MNRRIDFAGKRKTVSVEVPELETTIRLRALSVAQLQALQENDPQNGIRLLSWAIVDESGQRIYGDTESDLAELKEMSVTVSRLLIDELNRLHGISSAATDATVKN
jgi:hypothetical protein